MAKSPLSKNSFIHVDSANFYLQSKLSALFFSEVPVLTALLPPSILHLSLIVTLGSLALWASFHP